MFELPDSWTWDFWIADDGDQFHLFFLFASRALGDPESRHRRASIGHAVSRDLVRWERVMDAVVASDAPASDDVATWTGSVVRADDGLWWMFYTGCNDDPNPATQRVIAATSSDLMTWTKVERVLTEADPRWYETAATTTWRDISWRDPWVWRDADRTWQMFVTARGLHGEVFDRAVVGHAVSPDLESWTVLPPLSEPGGFGQIEVTQPFEAYGKNLMMFSCLSADVAPERRVEAGTGGVWVAEGASDLGPWDIAGARMIADDRFYAARVVRDRAGVDQFIAFRLTDHSGGFVGGLIDPVPLERVLAGDLLRTAQPGDSIMSGHSGAFPG